MPTRILIADDNALVRIAMRQVLEKVGPWAIIEASNGKEAVRLALEMRPSLIILDLAMPIQDGLSTARELTKLLPEIPILMHTLYWSPRIEIEALKAGVRKTVPKSESNVIVAAVQEFLGTEAAADNPVTQGIDVVAAAASNGEIPEKAAGGSETEPDESKRTQN